MANQTQLTNDYSTQQISTTLLEEISHALKNVSPFGSVEIYVQDNVVTQITIRNIKKTTQQISKTGQQRSSGQRALA